MIFSKITSELQTLLKRDMAQIRFLLKKNQGMAYARIVEIGREVGERYNMKLIVNFPKEGRIDEFDMYGKRDLSMIIDQEQKRFPMDRELIKQKARDVLAGIETEDAYMYEGKEGVRVFTENWKIDILPHSLHVWTEFSESVTEFCDWLLENVYKVRERTSQGL